MKKIITTLLILLTSLLYGEHIDLLVGTFTSVTSTSKGEFFQKKWYYDEEVYKHKLLTEYNIFNEETLMDRLYWLSGYGLRGEYLDRKLEVPNNLLFLDSSISLSSLEVSDLFTILHIVELGMRSEMVEPMDVMSFYISAEATLNKYNQENIPNLLAGGEFVRTGNLNYSRIVYQTLKQYLERNTILPTKRGTTSNPDYFLGLKDSDREIPEENPTFLKEYRLVRAVEEEDINKVEELISSNPPKDLYTYHGLSYVHLAALKGNYEITKLLLNKNYSPNKLNIFNASPLWAIAPDPEKIKIQKLLIKHGADINPKRLGASVIYQALFGKNFELVNMLLDKGAYISGFSYSRDTLLDVAFVKWDLETSTRIIGEFKSRGLIKNKGKYLIKALKELDGEAFGKVLSEISGINNEFNGETPLEVALSSSIRDKEVKVGLILDKLEPGNFKERGHPLVLQYILNENTRRLKANPGAYAPHLFEILDRTSREELIQGNDSLLYQLSQSNSREMILKASEYYQVSDEEILVENPFNTFRILANLGAKGYGDIIGKLAPYLSNEDFINQDGWSILTYLTLYKGYREPLKALVKAGFNPNLRMKNGTHLISRLAKYEDYETIIWLADNGAKIRGPQEVAAFIPPDAAISDAKKCIEELKIRGAIFE